MLLSNKMLKADKNRQNGDFLFTDNNHSGS